jgi:hypothetical protein
MTASRSALASPTRAGLVPATGTAAIGALLLVAADGRPYWTGLAEAPADVPLDRAAVRLALASLGAPGVAPPTAGQTGFGLRVSDDGLTLLWDSP